MPAKPIHKVLLIDDDSDDAIIFEDALKAIDPSIEYKHISSLTDHPLTENDIPDIAFIDINMPGVNGYESASLLRLQNHCFPIVMYSTSSRQENIMDAFSSGANFYLCKPTTFRKLVAHLQTLLRWDWDAILDNREAVLV